MQHMQESDDRPVGVRLQSLEQRLDSLEQVGQGGLPIIRLAGVEFRLEGVEGSLRDLKQDVRDLKDDVKGSTNRLVTIIGLCTGVITLVMLLGQILIP